MWLLWPVAHECSSDERPDLAVEEAAVPKPMMASLEPPARPEFEDRTSGDLPSFDLVSVVMPVLNAAHTLPEQLDALSKQTYQGAWEVVVADNGSTDGTPDLVEEWRDRIPTLRLVSALDREGCGHARNVAAQAAAGDFLVSCDADDIVEPDWLEHLVSAGRQCDMVGGRVDQTSLNDLVTQSWRPPFPTRELPVALRFLPYALGGNCGVRTDVWQRLGGWDENVAMSGEDVDFSWRLQLASYRLCFAPEAVVRYRFRSTARATARQFYSYGRMEPYLFRRYRARGVPRSKLREAIREWLWLAVHVGHLFGSMERRGVWMRKAAYRRGRFVGSWSCRVLYL